jgi:ABC-2 type transport system ATP-binding protein
MSESLAVEAHGLRKRFGRFDALSGVDLSIPAGSICALVGPNGAGKSTTFALACGFLAPTGGSIRVLGHDPRDKGALAGRVGAMPQDAPLPASTPVGELLAGLAELTGCSRAEARRQAREWLGRVGLEAQVGVRAGALSHGMRVRVSLAQAFLGSPELVLLDEPTAGLDPKSAETVRALIRSEAGRRTIVVSSHDLAQLESLCDHVVVLDRGLVVRQGTLADVTGQGEFVRIRLADPPTEALLAAVRLDATVAECVVEEGSGTIRLRLAGVEAADAISPLLSKLIATGARVVGVTRGDRLEERFLALTERR